MKPRPEISFGMAKSRGFTLVEVMITLTILGFILLMIFGVFRLALSAWEKGENLKEDYQQVRITSQLISRQIKSIVPYKIKSRKAEGNYMAFEGKARSVKFVSALPLKTRQPQGFVYVIYDFKKSEKGDGTLVLYEQRVLNRDFMSENPREESGVPLIEHLAEVRFEYYREEDAQKNQAAEWVEEWNTREEKDLPRAIRITLFGKKGEKSEERIPFTLLASLPSHRYEEIKTGPIRRIIPPRFSG
ncbi:MAG: prepilin-type N-terminal cleavage/methylation domain-containing protein [Deltaproteobacteria bacterium]|nr:prepilin-type N-terminal cleavage/methylation domain-containing protein [Deltaproteobacteria bacterium]